MESRLQWFHTHLKFARQRRRTKSWSEFAELNRLLRLIKLSGRGTLKQGNLEKGK